MAYNIIFKNQLLILIVLTGAVIVIMLSISGLTGTARIPRSSIRTHEHSIIVTGADQRTTHDIYIEDDFEDVDGQDVDRSETDNTSRIRDSTR